MKKLLLTLTLAASLFMQAQKPQSSCKLNHPHTLFTAPANLRSDTIDILKTTINLNITDFTTKVITGNTALRFTPKINGQDHIMLDLLKMTIDSIKTGNALLGSAYNDTLLKVNFATTYNSTDTIDLIVYYHGVPQTDASGFGGFSFSGAYAYNLGVGFDADPHCFGRVWFPCFDNFVEKCPYEFNITTNGGKVAVCNGQLVNDVTIGTDRTRTWVMDKEIPSYLASVAVNAYTQVNKTFAGINGPVPVVLAAMAADTTNLKNSFVHLQNAFDKFEQSYGPYLWNRVGYVVVPFTGGAMEHATNIAYPKAAVNGATTYEDILMAHELSHHWWGDLVTCETAEDMWINEGMASYSAFLFNEATYNYATYLKKVKDNHDIMVQNAHLSEKGYRAISGVPHEYTYGDHVYDKGADVVHTMRTYMGDSLFYAGLKYVLSQKQYKNMNSPEFANLLTTGTGVNMSNFFNDWVLNGGWPHFSIDSFSVSGSAPNYNVSVYVKQKLDGAPNYYTGVPLEITFMDAGWNKVVKNITVSGQNSSASYTLAALPVYAGINMESKISDAVSSEYRTIKTTGTSTFVYGRTTLTINNPGIDSSFIRVEHNFAAPDSIKNNVNNYRLANNRYWKIDGVTGAGFQCKGRFYYDGRLSINKTVGSILSSDTVLTANTPDSLIMLYRRNAADDWHEVSYYSKTKLFGSLSKYGYFTVDTVLLGEYAFANGVSTVLSVEKNTAEKTAFSVYPNPSKDNVTVDLANIKLKGNERLQLSDAGGKMVLSRKISSSTEELELLNYARGIYVISVYKGSKLIGSEKIILE
ncbi:MAG: M1 family aminopeptidase [Bacteroidia bacterium]